MPLSSVFRSKRSTCGRSERAVVRVHALRPSTAEDGIAVRSFEHLLQPLSHQLSSLRLLQPRLAGIGLVGFAVGGLGFAVGCARCADTGRAVGSGNGGISGFRADSGRRARCVDTGRAAGSEIGLIPGFWVDSGRRTRCADTDCAAKGASGRDDGGHTIRRNTQTLMRTYGNRYYANMVMNTVQLWQNAVCSYGKIGSAITVPAPSAPKGYGR